MIPISYDFHIHSCLSPCGDNDSTPVNIAGMAALSGLDAIALTDHNSARNCPVFMKACKEYGVIGIPGMEVTTFEEVHVVCLFETLEAALEYDKHIYDHLIKVENDPEIFGEERICDEEDKIIGYEPNLLINATDISFDLMYDDVASYNGIMIPAHIDKGSNSLLSNLGFVPENSKFKCVEVKDMKKWHSIREKNPYLMDCDVITNSDAHYLKDINMPINTLYVKEKSIKGILDVLKCD